MARHVDRGSLHFCTHEALLLVCRIVRSTDTSGRGEHLHTSVPSERPRSRGMRPVNCVLLSRQDDSDGWFGLRAMGLGGKSRARVDGGPGSGCV